MAESVNHPAHYGGAGDPYETIKVIEAWNLGFNLGNAVKYISRNKGNYLEDLKKARWYLDREISNTEREPEDEDEQEDEDKSFIQDEDKSFIQDEDKSFIQCNVWFEPGETKFEDLKKARSYLDREISNAEREIDGKKLI